MLPNVQTHGIGIQAKLLYARVGMQSAEASVPSSASVKESVSYKNLHSTGGDPTPNLRIKARVCLPPKLSDLKHPAQLLNRNLTLPNRSAFSLASA